MTETRHYHGDIWHDHDGGEEPHTHKPGDRNLIGPRPASSGAGASAAFGIGAALVLLGALCLLVTSGNHSACSSVWAAGAQQCGEVNAVWTLGMLGVVIGVVLLIVGAILRGKE
jgi:hypothetical protein